MSYSLCLCLCMCVAQAREKYKHGMLCINATDEKKRKKEKKKIRTKSRKLPLLPFFCLFSTSSPPFSNTLRFLQAAISTKLVPRVLIAVYEAHLLARESVFVWSGIQWGRPVLSKPPCGFAFSFFFSSTVLFFFSTPPLPFFFNTRMLLGLTVHAAVFIEN